MGASQSGEGGVPEGGDAQSPFSSLPASAQRGWKVLAVSAQSPSSNLGIVPYFSVLVAIDGTRLQGDDESVLYPLIRENAQQQFTFLDLATLQTRSVSITSRRGWGGEGLLGLMIKADRFANAHLEALHVLDVHRGSPAEKAGLRAHSDWLLGTSRLAFKGYDQLDVFLSQHDGRSATLLVFNRDTWSVREVQLTPSSQWGGAGALGCDVGLGLLHQIPIDGQHAVRYEADQSMAPAAELTQQQQQQPTVQQTPQQQATQATEQHQQQPPQEQLQSQPQFQQPEATTLGQLVAQQQSQAHPQQPPQQPQQQQWAPNQAVSSSQGLPQYSPQVQQQFAPPQSLSPQQGSAQQQQPQPTSPERQVQQPPQQAYAQPAPPPQYGQHPSPQHLSPQQAHVSPQPQHQSPQQSMQQQPGALSAALPSFPGSVPFQPVQPQHSYTPAMQQYQQPQQSFQQHMNAVQQPPTAGAAGVYYAPGASTAFQQQSQQQQPPQQPHVQMQAPQQFVQQPYPQQQQAFAQQPQQYYTQQQQAPQQQQGLP